MNAGMKEPTGLIAVDKMGGKVLFLEPTTLETLGVLDRFPPRPHELLVVRETLRAYVPIFGDGVHGNNPNPGHQIAVIDLGKSQHIADIDLGDLAAPHTLRVGPDGHLYITCENSGVVAVIARPSHEVIGTIGTGSTNSHRLEISPDGQRLYTENEEDRSITVIDLPARKRLREIETPHALAGLAVTQDGRRVIAVDDEEPALFLIDPDAGRIVETISLEQLDAPAQVARYSPDFRCLAVTSMHGNTVTLMSRDLSAQTVIPVGSQPMDMAFLGDHLFVACQGDGTIHKIDLVKNQTKGIFHAGVGCETLAFF